jgi:NADH-quinone oxidoreductase subunit J
MTGIVLLAQWSWLTNLLSAGVFCLVISLYLLLPRSTPRRRGVGAAVGLVGLILLAALVAEPGLVWQRWVFRLLALVAVGSAAVAVSMPSAVYMAIWFAVSLMGVAGLFLFQGAQFLSVVTIVVYAGAIVVTFLFVLMLAQPEGHAVYDRITWGLAPKLLAVLMGALLIGVVGLLLPRNEARDRMQVTAVVTSWQDEAGGPLVRAHQIVRVERVATGTSLRIVLRGNVPPELPDRLRSELPAALQTTDELLAAAARQLDIEFLSPEADVLDPAHTAHLGRDLFSRHLVSVELAGTLLLAALVGAVAIVLHGNQRPADDAEVSLAAEENASPYRE